MLTMSGSSEACARNHCFPKHSKVPGSSAVNVKFASGEPTVPDGPEWIVVSGAVVSTLHARLAGVELVAVCGGTGTCATCRVRVMAGELTPVTASEEFELSADELAAGYRLACQVRTDTGMPGVLVVAQVKPWPPVVASLLHPGYTMASVIANEFTEATYELYLQSLIEIALVLFVLTLLLNFIARFLVWRVLANSPATDAGLAEDDVITSVDGKPAAKLTLAEASALAAMVTVALPEVVSAVGNMVQVTPGKDAGTLQVNATFPVNPFRANRVSEEVATLPGLLGAKVMLRVPKETLKSAGGAAVLHSFTKWEASTEPNPVTVSYPAPAV